MENNENIEIKEKTPAQDVLIIKMLKSSKILDKEYTELKAVLDHKVETSYDASIFISYVLALVKFRRAFLSGKHKSYKKCYFCNSRLDVKRVCDIKTNEKLWMCETCYLNWKLSLNIVPSKFIKGPKEAQVKITESREVLTQEDIIEREHIMDNELSSSQEDLILSRERD